MRKAFTLIELLVVIFVIALLIAIVMPAVQGVREAARRIQCTNNQKNLVTGLIHYENARGSLPGWRDYITVAPPGGRVPLGIQAGEEIAAQASWIFSILPYIEQGDLYDRLKNGQVDIETTFQPISLLHCPSLTEGPRSRATHYIANGGAVDDFMGERDPVTTDGNIANGPFLDRCKIVAGDLVDCPCGTQCRYNRNVAKYKNAVVRLSDISRMDGTTYTLMTSENVQRGYWVSSDIVHFYHLPNGEPAPVRGWRNAPLSDGRRIIPLDGIEDTIEGSVAFCWPRFYRVPNQFRLCEIAYPTGPRGFQHSQAVGADPDAGSFVPDPGAIEPERTPVYINLFPRKEFTSWYQSARPSSEHAPVFIVSFCDGNVRRLDQGIGEEVFVQLMTAGDTQSDAGWGGSWNLLYGKLPAPPF